MKIIKPSVQLLDLYQPIEAMKHLEARIRNCYKSENKTTEDSYERMLTRMIDSHHYSTLEHISLTAKFICSRACSHQLVRHRHGSYSQESQRYVRLATNPARYDNMTEQDVVDLYISGVSMLKVSQRSKEKYTEWDVYKILSKHEVARRNKGERGITNHNYFNKIDTAEKAYLLGFIQADGSINLNRNSLSITQKNGWFITSFVKTFIQPHNRTTRDRNCDRINLHSAQIIKDLLNKGIVPNKSANNVETDMDKLWESVPYKYKYDLLRGLLDGDGSLRFFKQKNPKETFSCSISWLGNKFILDIISKFIEIEFSYKAKVRKVPNCANLFSLAITKPSIGVAFCEKLYKNFKFPFGHPVKTERGIEHIDHKFRIHGEFNRGIEVMCPPNLFGKMGMWTWAQGVDSSEKAYTDLIEIGVKAQDARSVLPNCAKTELDVTMNPRAWRDFIKLRMTPHAQDEIRELTKDLLDQLMVNYSPLFKDLK